MSHEPPPAGGYGPTGGCGGPPGYGGPPPGEPPKTYLVHNILGIMSCLPVIGIIGLVFSLQVNGQWQGGDYAGACSSAQTARTMGIIGLVLFIIGMLFVVVVVLVYLGFFLFLTTAAETSSGTTS
ncbi:putative membrane protein [Nocardiopsis arvandica]|uniref:Putative membrane protein n=1 Tax=Nocardiopsis sinuspersici TaxID=501010 RepID=A0A7Y9X8G8_9ACTN|nr:CD225/dispanin family protein [Nocardiopsis sinuspersici]NYH50933.1 putative membrane protein [Nocardiopsis sinuspersici]